MALDSSVKVVLGSISFAIFLVLAVFLAVPFLLVERTAGSLLGGMLMVIFQVITADQAYAAIDLQILGLLFGTMVASVYLERADMFKYLGKLLSRKSRGAKDLICQVCLISTISILTEFVLKIARQHNLPPHPFLLALASSANIGSTATPIGNPQNLVIAVQSKISFGNFLIGILPAMIMGVIVNALLLLCMYWKLLSIEKDEEDVAVEVIVEEEVNSHRFSPATMSHFTSLNSQEWNFKLEVMVVQSSPGTSVPMGHNEIQGVPSGTLEFARNSNASKEAANDVSSQVKVETIPSKGVASLDRLRDVLSVLSFTTRWKKILWKSCVYLVTIGMLIALLLDLNMSWTAITAALALVVLDFRDARPSFEKYLWDFMEPYSRIDRLSGIAILAVVILVMSNLASNVPTVLFLGARVAALAATVSAVDEKKECLILA
ncbi:silicon efflux transporter lsi3 [Quercus suber]|uniref:Silicon efflux transporter lsi3 n=1 Tax=Quercus suber TaxID=58331 RepID=A0AAW0IM37_QUESU